MNKKKTVLFAAEQNSQNIDIYFKSDLGHYSSISLPDQHHVDLNLASWASRGLTQITEAEYRLAVAEGEAERLQRDQDIVRAQNAILDLPTPSEQRARENFHSAENMWIQSMMTSVNPGTTPLANAYSKLRMAQRRRAELDWVLWAYFVHTRYKVVCKPNESGCEHGLYVEFEIKPDFLLWGNVLAEFVENLLAALDQLIYSLNTKAAGGQYDEGDRIPTAFKFPFALRRDKIAGSKRDDFFFNCAGQPIAPVRNIDSKAREIIEGVQTYNSHSANPEQNPFEIIRKLSNIDKHREPLPIVLRPQFDYFFQTDNAPVSEHGIEWFGRDYKGQTDGKIGHFTAPPEVVIKVEESITLQPCIESVEHTAVDTFIHPIASIVGSEMSLPQGLEEAVAKLLQDIGNVMGWDENLVTQGIPVNPSEEAFKRKWLPSVGPCSPFSPISKFGTPRRIW